MANEKIGGIVRTEFGITSPEIKQEIIEANMEPIDMEVSSGTGDGSSSDASSSKSHSSNVASKNTNSPSNSKKSDPGASFLVKKIIEKREK